MKLNVNRWLLVALAVVAVGMTAALVVVLSIRSDEAAPAQSSVPMVTVTVGAAGAGLASYTDPLAPDHVGTMSPRSSALTRKVTVPAGTSVGVTLSGTAGYPRPSCWISDATDRITYIEGTTACTYKVG